VRHSANPDFWDAFATLPPHIQVLARRNFEVLKANPRHPSLHLKQIGRFWSTRVGLSYRALGIDSDGDVTWFWIGSHAEYNRVLKHRR